MSVQSVVRLPDYDPARVDEAVSRSFDALGIARDIRPGMRVALKPNLVMGKRPEAAVTTHPAILRAVARNLAALGAREITIADSPSGLYTRAALGALYRATGLEALGDCARINFDTGSVPTPCPDGCRAHGFDLIRPIVEADYIVNVAKLKTHGMVTLSAGVKNLFGCVPGLQKPQLHYQYPAPEAFARMLIELARTVRPQLTLIDAVDCMEGNGPSAGRVRHMGLLLASRDPFSQDDYAARLMGIAPDSVPILRIAREMGLARPEEIELLGDEPAPQKPFLLPDAVRIDFMTALPARLREPVGRALARFLRPWPAVDQAKCVGCGKCAQSCPAHIIAVEGGKARIARRNCIACFCCQELCPAKAVYVRRRIRF